MSHKLLLADDSVTIQRVIELTFSGEDVEVVTVNDGEQAIARIPTEKPDIILADIGMPKRSGYDVSAFVKERADLAHVPVLLLAGAFEPVDDERAKQVKCDGVLVKPFEPQQVIARVRELIERRARGAAVPHAGTSPVPSAVAVPPPQLVSASPTPQAAPSPPTPEPPSAEPELARPEIGVASSEPADSSLEDYFDRLDAAFATLGNAQSASTPAPSPPAADDLSGTARTPPPAVDEAFAVPTMDDLLGGSPLRATPEPPTPLGRIAPPPPEPPDSLATLTAAPRPPASTAPAQGNVIADAFNALLAIEQGERDASTFRVGASAAPAAPPRVEITDALVDDLTQRVLARLSPDAARDVVAELVSGIAERLVREEIERIRNLK